MSFFFPDFDCGAAAASPPSRNGFDLFVDGAVDHGLQSTQKWLAGIGKSGRDDRWFIVNKWLKPPADRQKIPGKTYQEPAPRSVPAA